jgi:hypothetical protein
MRDRIIAEIRRLAAADGSAPPGRGTFERETGIRQAEWYGIYWARWGDALAEAGFSPNELRSKFDANLLMQKLAEASRHYGRVPTSGDFRMYRRTDPEFPSHSTIENHFPTKAALIVALRTWLSEQPQFEDVVALLPNGLVEQPSPRVAKVRDGYVYLLQSGPHYKIGRSDDIDRRMKEIRVALPDKSVVAHFITTDDPPGIEAYWHKRFADRRANGEWFKLTPADVLAFKRRKFQ